MKKNQAAGSLPRVFRENWKPSEHDPELFVSVYLSPDPAHIMRPTLEQLRFLKAIGSGEFSEGWFAGGNSAGKTYTAKFLGTWFSVYKKRPNKTWSSYEEYLKTPYHILCTGPESKQAMELWEHIEASFKNSPVLRHRVSEIHTGTRRNIHPYILLKNGTVIEAVGLHDKGKHIEGGAYDLILINETADVRHLTHCIERVLEPRTWRRGGILCGFTTPKGKGEDYLFWRRGQKLIDEKENRYYLKNVYSQYADSRSNPYANQEKITQYLSTKNEDLINERIRGQYVDSAYSAFKDSHIHAVVDDDLSESIYPSTNHEYITGIDFGRKSDYTCAVTLDISVTPHILVNFYRAGGGAVSWEMIFSDILSIHNKYGGEVIYDATSAAGDLQGEWLSEMDIPLIPFQFAGSPAKKVALINNLQDYIAQKKIKMPNISQLIDELHLYPGNLEDKGFDTDCVMGLALACYGAKEYGPLGAVEYYNR